MRPSSDEIRALLSFAIRSAADETRSELLRDLAVLVQQHSAIRVSPSSEWVVISGEDELQLEEVRRNLLRNGQAAIGELKIAFRETIRKTAEAEGKYIRQTGGSGNYGHVKIRVEPNEPGAGFEFVDAIKGGVVPKEYIKPTEQGIREALTGGILAGYEMVDFKAVLYDGSYHDVDSNEMAFKIAGSMAFKEAARKASPVLLEPVMAVEVTVPEEHMGTIIGDINSRRGRIEGMEHSGGSQVIKAMVPLKEMLRSSLHGRPQYAMQFAGYEPVPPRHGPFDDDAFSYAKKPLVPRPGSGSTVAKVEISGIG